MMKQNKVLIVIAAICTFVVMGMALPFHADRNLKVLPKDISDTKLDSIMESYTAALGVKCDFCHTKIRNSPDSLLDYVSDKEPMKENARNMMRMTIELNKTYFYFDKNIQPEYLSVVHCKTCHRGEPIPPEK